MSRLDKAAEEIQHKIKQVLNLNTMADKDATAGNLTVSEAESLNKGLSGEEITQGFTEYTKTDEYGNRQSVNFYGDKREGILDLTPDSLAFYRKKYPNVAKAYLSGGIVTLLDNRNNAILDSSGEPVTVDYNKVKDSPTLDLVSFYINHSGGEIDINKMFELQALQESVNSTPKTDENYQILMSEIEIQKLDMMSEDERKNNITTKMWNAFNKGDKKAWFNALSEFYDYECRILDRKLGITGTKDFIKEKTHLNDLVAYIDKILDDNTDKLTKTELAWEIIKGVGDAIDSFIGTQGLTMMGVLGAGTKAASLIPKVGPWLAGAIQAYFGTEGAVLIGSGMIDGYNAETKEQARGAGAELGLGTIMAKGGSKSFTEGFKGLELKAFRTKIREVTTLEDLNEVREIIEKSSYTKSEKQMLQNECIKQQGVIQSNWKEVKESAKESPLYNRKVYDEKIQDKNKWLKLSYNLFRICRTPEQKEIAKLILSDKRLYLSEGINFERIAENCTSQEVVNMYMQYFSTLLRNQKFQMGNKYTPKGAVDEYMLTYTEELRPELFDIQMKILDAYLQNKNSMSSSEFGLMLNNVAKDLPSCKKLLEYLQSEKFYKQRLDDYSERELYGVIKCNSNISFEKLYGSTDARNIANAYIKNKILIDLRNKILQDNELYTGNPIWLKNGTLLYDYGAGIRAILNNLEPDIYNTIPAINLSKKILLNETLRKDAGVLRILLHLADLKYYTNEKYMQAIEQLFVMYEAKEIEGLTYDKLGFVSEILHDYYNLSSDNQNAIYEFVFRNHRSSKDVINTKELVIQALKSFNEIYKKFTEGREYSCDNITELWKCINQGCRKEVVEKMSADKDFSANNILYVAGVTNEKTINFTRKLLKSNSLTADEKVNTIMTIGDNFELMKFTEVLLEQGNLNLKLLPKILEATKILDSHDAGGNNGKVDSKKVDKYLRLLQSPKTRDWAVQMLNEGWDIETVSRLSATKQNFFGDNKSNTHVKDENVKYFMDFGLNEKEADAIVKSISQSGVINTKMQSTAIDLINAGIPKHKIGQILSSATVTGEYNARVPADAMALNGLGLNAFLERFLPVVNNLSPEDVAIRFNTKTKKQLKSMIENISEETKPALRAKGFDLEGILKKLDSKGIVKETKNGKPQKVLEGLRNRSDITGFERMLIEKFNPVESIWRSSEATKQWAEEKYNLYKNREYESARTTEQVNIEEVNKKRAEGLRAWFDYMDNEPELKKNPFARVLLSEFITKNLLPENSALPPILNKTLVKQVLADALDKGSSFERGYRAELNNAAKQSSAASEVELDGRKMTWYTIPQTDSSHPDFAANVAKVRAFSDGTNWCIRTWNADNYVQQGNMHFLVDETGMTQVCVREAEGKRYIAEIQQRRQNGSLPVAYVDFIQQFVKSKKLKGCEDGIKKALKQKPEFDKTRDKLQELANRKDYKAILEMMGINVKVLPDGSWEISHYTSYMNEIALNDYGIKENDLLSNVSKIKGDAKFQDSNATSLPNLEEVGGELDFGYSDISNLKKLKKVKGKHVNWHGLNG